MNILKNNDGKNFFSADAEQIFFDSIAPNPKIPGRARKIILKFTAGLAVAVLFVAVGCAIYTKLINLTRETPYFLFKLAVMDTDGRPVAGARIYFQNDNVGVTDSFGEWRSFLKAPLDSKVTLKVEKNFIDKKVSAQKNIVIPTKLDDKEEAELVESITIARKGSILSSAVNPSPTDLSGDTEDHTGKILAKIAELFSEKKSARLTTEKAGDQREDKILVGAYSNTIWFSMQKNDHLNKDFSGADEKANLFLQKKVLPELQNLSVKNGLALDVESERQVILQHVPTKTSQYTDKGAILVTEYSYMSGKSNKASVLVKYCDTAEQTAKKIQFLVQKAEKLSIQSPAAGWQKMNLIVDGKLARDAQIFVAGLPASKIKENAYKFWGKNDHTLPVLIVKNNKLVFVEKITPQNASAQISTTALLSKLAAK